MGAEMQIVNSSPNATVNHLHGVGLLLDDLALVGCCGGAANVNPVRAAGRQQEQTLEGAVRAQEGRRRIRVESALQQRQRRQATRIQGCSLLGVIEVVRTRFGRLLWSPVG
jgi:hypothetical protein